MNLLSGTEAAAGGGSALFMLIFYVLVIGVIMYFMAIRPQKKEQKRIDKKP